MHARRLVLCLLTTFALLLGAHGRAEIVTLEGKAFPTARAEYRSGQARLPAVLILHGFLQTHEFGTVHRMVEGLSGEGYTVLAPTLTLGVPYRRSSLPCEAIHMHRFTDAYPELDAWLAWLKQRHRGPIVLIGHSFGSTILLGYLQQRKPKQVRKFIAVSITEARTHKPEVEVNAMQRLLRRRVANNDRSLVVYPLMQCQRYTAPPVALLSYLERDAEFVLKELRALDRDKVIIMGSSDDFIAQDWIERLRKTGVVHIVNGANHFLDGMHEFDLLELLLKELKLASS